MENNMSNCKLKFTNGSEFFDYAYINGYHIRERILEGVLFKVEPVEKDGVLSFKASFGDSRDEAYLKHNFMNIPDILAEVVYFAENIPDMFMGGDEEKTKETGEYEDVYLYYEGVTTDPDYAYSLGEIKEALK